MLPCPALARSLPQFALHFVNLFPLQLSFLAFGTTSRLLAPRSRPSSLPLCLCLDAFWINSRKATSFSMTSLFLTALLLTPHQIRLIIHQVPGWPTHTATFRFVCSFDSSHFPFTVSYLLLGSTSGKRTQAIKRNINRLFRFSSRPELLPFCRLLPLLLLRLLLPLLLLILCNSRIHFYFGSDHLLFFTVFIRRSLLLSLVYFLSTSSTTFIVLSDWSRI